MLGDEDKRGRIVALGRQPQAGDWALRRLAARDSLVAAVVEHVAAHCGVDAADLLRRNRCRAEIAAARQLAMYLVNVQLDYSMTQVGELFGRDRTTVSHACNAVEDKRDDGSAFDDSVSQLEAEIAAMVSGADLVPEVRHAAG